MRRLAGLASAAVLWSLAAASAEETIDAEGLRLKQEAVALFRGVLAPDATEPCALASVWLDYPIPEDVARKYFAVKAHAELSPPEHTETPAEILDPKGTLKAAFCDPAERAKRKAALKDEFERAGRGKDDRDPQGRERVTVNWQVSFPVFNDDFSVASFVLVSNVSKLLRSPDGAVIWSPFDRGSIETYRKQQGRWTNIDSEELFTAE